jgi:hypothetical protein
MQQYTGRRASARLKWDILTSIYGTTCVYCHDNPATQIDHVIPVSWKLSNHISNLRPCCQLCNLMVSACVFETFEDKYEWMRAERLRNRRNAHNRTVCVRCLLPYQRPLHSPSLFLCAECYDAEYEKDTHLRPQWREWLHLCSTAGFIVEAHRQLAAWKATVPRTTLTSTQYATKLAQIYQEHEDWEMEGIQPFLVPR